MTPLPAAIKSDDDLNRVAAHRIGILRAVSAIEREPEVAAAMAVMARAAVRRRELETEFVDSRVTYDRLIEAFARRKLQPGSKTYAAALCEVRFVSCPSTTIDVVDVKLAMPFLIANCPECVVSKPTIVKAGFTSLFKSMVEKFNKRDLAKVGLSVTPPHDNCHIELRVEG